MFSATRQAFSPAIRRAFSTTPRRSTDVAKLTLVGRLAKVPEQRTTKNGREFIVYTITTTNQAPPPNAEGLREDPKTSWHNVLSFSPTTNNYLRNLTKGSLVYVEANYELREADPSADPATARGQRHVFLRHEAIRVIKRAIDYSENSEQST